MQDAIFENINRIIERDSKFTTYKFALLRGVIDIIQENSPFITVYGNRVTIPTGLLIERWMMYYYPILESDISIPQSSGEKNLSFSIQFKKLIDAYKKRNCFSGFYLDLKRNGIPKDLYNDFILLSKKIYKAITEMPMKHIGFSITHRHYSIFTFEPGYWKMRPYTLDISYLINNFGRFSIPLDYYKSFRILGSFINGQDSLLFKWAEFSVNASRRSLSTEMVLNQVLKNPITDRDISESKEIFEMECKANGTLICIWTGKKIKSYEIDHVIPFSVWMNNDLWNLLPAEKVVNNKKRDKIPSPECIEKNRYRFLYYWELLNRSKPVRFQKELQLSLIGGSSPGSWQETALNQLQNSCYYLINVKGFEPWEI